MLQVLHDQAREVDVDGGGPLGRSVPLVRSGSEAGTMAPHMHAQAHVYQSSSNSGGVWLEELKFNKHCSTFVLFDKKFPILD
jgi:hypothetical protein